MRLKDYCEALSLNVIAGEIKEQEVTSPYSCDLLSWVMANGDEGMAWITVQIHSNILAVASLLDFACILVPEDIKVDADVITKANEQGIVVLGTSMNVYEIFKKSFELGL